MCATFGIATFVCKKINNRLPFHDCVCSESLQEDHRPWDSQHQEEQSLDIRQVVQHTERPYALDSQLGGLQNLEELLLLH